MVLADPVAARPAVGGEQAPLVREGLAHAMPLRDARVVGQLAIGAIDGRLQQPHVRVELDRHDQRREAFLPLAVDEGLADFAAPAHTDSGHSGDTLRPKPVMRTFFFRPVTCR